MTCILAIAWLMATPVHAQVADITDCKVVGPDTLLAVHCDVTNRSGTAIAEILFQLRVFEEGRSVPWIDLGSKRTPRPATVPGGVEPNETRSVFLWPVTIPPEADESKLRVEITPFRFLDVNGVQISLP